MEKKSDYEDYASCEFKNFKFLEKHPEGWKIKGTPKWLFWPDTSTGGPITYKLRDAATFRPAEIREMERVLGLLLTGTTENKHEEKIIHTIAGDFSKAKEYLVTNAVKQLEIAKENGERWELIAHSRQRVIKELQTKNKTLAITCSVLSVILFTAAIVGWLSIIIK